MADPNRYERALASDAFEHDDTANVKVKRVGLYGWNSDSLEYKKLAVDSSGQLISSSSDATNFAFYGSTSDATYDYVGKQASDGKWYIMRIHKTTGAADYAVGDSDMATAWAAVASQDYDVWDNHNQATANAILASSTKPFLLDENNVETQMLSDNYFGGAPVTIESGHHEIHCGDSVVMTDVTDLGNGATRDILLVTPTPSPTTKRYHLYVEVVSESETDYKLYEDTTTSNNGTPVTPYNRNRADAVVVPSDEVDFFHTPTVTGVGTLLEQEHWGSGRGVGGQSRSDNEWILKNNAKYLIRLTNATSNNNQVALKINYYVHPGV